MANKRKEIGVKSKFNVKEWIAKRKKTEKVTPIKPEAGEALIEQLKFLRRQESPYNRLECGDLGLTLEFVFRKLHPNAPDIERENRRNKKDKRPRNSIMSLECQDWAGLSRRDPFVPEKHNWGGIILKGFWKTWSVTKSLTRFGFWKTYWIY